MYRLRNYHSMMLAQLHAAALRDQGIMASVVGENLTGINPMSLRGIGTGSLELIVSSPRVADQANEVLDAIDAMPEPDSDTWEDALNPDLTLLDPSMIPSCPNCGRDPDPSTPLDPCSGCKKPLDLVDLIVQTHGPEALDPCYAHEPHSEISRGSNGATPNTPPPLSDDEMDNILLDCVKCQHPLDDLGPKGACPNCGTAFDRESALRALFPDLF